MPRELPFGQVQRGRQRRQEPGGRDGLTLEHAQVRSSGGDERLGEWRGGRRAIEILDGLDVGEGALHGPAIVATGQMPGKPSVVMGDRPEVPPDYLV